MWVNETRVDAHIDQKDEDVTAVVTAGSEMPHVGAGNWTQGPVEEQQCFYCWALCPVPKDNSQALRQILKFPEAFNAPFTSCHWCILIETQLSIAATMKKLDLDNGRS